MRNSGGTGCGVGVGEGVGEGVGVTEAAVAGTGVGVTAVGAGEVTVRFSVGDFRPHQESARMMQRTSPQSRARVDCLIGD